VRPSGSGKGEDLPFTVGTTIGVVTDVATERADTGESATSAALSVCVMTAGPGPRVAALLELLRPVAAEIVVALDDRADEDTERAIAAAADLVIRYPYREPVDRPLRWLFSRCQGEWILNVDDDEIPGAELLAALPALVSARDVTHYWVLRRWLWPDETSTIAEHPWSTDYQLRLVRNDPLLLSFPSETHRPLQAIGPHRFLRLPLYHADLILSPLERREAKARRYETLRPGLRAAGEPLNHMFLPENRPGVRTEALPADDVAVVQRVLRGAAVASVGTAVVTTVDATEIDRFWAGRDLAEEDYRASIEVLDEPERLLECERRTFDVLVGNLGGTTWPAGPGGEPQIRLSYQWLASAGDVVAFGLHTTLPADLASGDTQVVPLHVLAPSRAGRYTLRLDLVHEGVRWFRCDVEREVEITRRLRVALVGDEAEVARTLERLTDEAPEFEPVVLSSSPPPARFGPPRAPDLREYLLHDTIPGRLRDWPAILGRSLALARVVRRKRAGLETRPLLHGGEEFLDALAGCTHLLRVPGSHAGVRERWLERMTLRAARRLGVNAVVPGPGELGLR
jgi:hypothetical protein